MAKIDDANYIPVTKINVDPAVWGYCLDDNVIDIVPEDDDDDDDNNDDDKYLCYHSNTHW